MAKHGRKYTEAAKLVEPERRRMLFLSLAVCCSLAIGMIFKHAAREGLHRLALLTVNYAVALVTALVLLGLGVHPIAGGLVLHLPLLMLGVATGALFILGFFVYALATQVAGMSLAIGVMRVSVVIPFLASWVIWNEVPTPAQGLGLLVAGIAFFLIAHRTRGVDEAATARGGRVLLVLALLFAAGGIVDVALKTFDEAFAAANSQTLFLLLIFGVAFLIGLAIVVTGRVRSGVWPSRAVLGWGVLLGLANYGSVEFILRAIRELSGPFVFPANNIAIVMGAALLGVLVWGERLTRANLVGLGCAAVALALLAA